MRARNPCLLMRRRLRGRYVGPIHSSREDGKRTRSSARRSRLTFPQTDRTFGPPLLDVPPHSQSRMEQSTKEAWKRLLDEARRELPDATVRTWLEPAVPIALDDGRLIVGAPDQFAVEWNESKHATVLARAAERVFGRPTAVVFRVQEDRQQRPQMDFFVAPREPATVDRSGVPTTPLNERYTFQTFVIGKSNELAAAAAHAVAEAPGKTYNPLFIYGATGLGKTHLMQAIAHAVLEKNPETRLQYFGAEQFINDVIESIHARTMSEFRRRYRNDVDLLLVDDVHFLEGKEMHIVDEEQIHVVAVAPAELGHRARVNRFDHVVDELLGAEVLQPGLGVFLEHRVRDRLHQMRLAESRRAVDEQRVVRLPGRFRDGVRGGCGELVRLADDERLEGVAFVERGGRDRRDRCDP